MATSSSDESSTAPKDFHLSSSLDSGSRSSPNKQKCPLCCNFRKKFYCKECVHIGQIYRSKSQTTERYSDKQKELVEVQNNKKSLERKCLKLLETRQREDALRTKIRQCKERTRIIKLAVEEKKQKRPTHNDRLSDVKVVLNKYSKQLPRYQQKVDELENCAAVKIERVKTIQEQLKDKQAEIQKIAKIRIEQLVKYIFPITKIQPHIEVSSESDMVTAIAEASQTIYTRDSWEYTDNSGELQYSIVAPTLPGSGNYSLYNVGVSQNKDGVPGSNSSLSVEQNPAFNISAALTYTAQLIHVLAFYLNVRLPYRMVHSDFCSSDMNEKQFTRRVARLNANVLHLCFTQNIDLNTLRSTETIHNLLQLIDTKNPDLGRQGPIEVDTEKALLLEQPLTLDLQISEDSDSDDGDSIHGEWEAVPHVQCPEVPAGAVNVQSSQMINTQQASSMAGGLVNSAAASIASMWRGITGR